MHGNLIYQTKKPKGILVMIILMMFGLVVADYFLIQSMLKDVSLQQLKLTGVVACTGFLILLFFGIFKISYYRFYENHMEEWALLGDILKSWKYSDLKGWYEIKGRAEDKGYDYIFVITDKGKIPFISKVLYNNVKIKEVLLNRVPQDKQTKKNIYVKSRRLEFFTVVILTTIFFIGSAYLYIHLDDKVAKESLQRVVGTLNKNYIIDTTDASVRLTFGLKEFPEVTFFCSNKNNKSFNYTYLGRAAKSNKTVTLLIEKIEYDKWIVKSRPTTFWDRQNSNLNRIEPYEINDNEYIYLSLDAYNLEQTDDRLLGIWGLLFLGIAGLALSLYLNQSLQKASNASLDEIWLK